MNSRETVSMQTGTYEIHLKKMSEKATDMPLTLQLSFPICRNNDTNLSKNILYCNGERMTKVQIDHPT